MTFSYHVPLGSSGLWWLFKFPLLWWLWQFWGVLAGYLADYPSIWIWKTTVVFSWLKEGVGLERNTTKVKCPPPFIRSVLHTVDHPVEGGVCQFFHVTYFFFPCGSVWTDITTCSKYFKNRESYSVSLQGGRQYWIFNYRIYSSKYLLAHTNINNWVHE